MTNQFRPLVLALLIGTAFAAPVAVADNVKIAMIDPLSGPFTSVGQNLLNSLQAMAQLSNQEKWAGDNTIEVVPFDSKGSPQEAQTQFKNAADQGYHYIMQGTGSGVALGLVDALNKHNARNPGKEIVFLNYGSSDPDLTNSKCSFWHFRFDSNSDMKMEAITTYMAKDPDIKKVYIVGTNHAGGHQVSHAAKDYLKRKRPDIRIVGDDLHPIGQVKDFSPYVAKIKASGADTVITGNFGADLALLIKSAREANLKVDFLTYYGGTTGVPGAIGAAGAERVKLVTNWHPNNEIFSGKEIATSFKKKYNDDYYAITTHSSIMMLAKAIKEAKSADPVKVAFAMEGMKIKALNGEVEMRKTDHQLQQPIYIATWTKVNGKDVKFDQENTGYGWKTDQKIDTYIAAQPTSCQMKRPAQ